jgi:hypothetical protein
MVQSQLWTNSSQDPISKKHITKRTGKVAQNVGLGFKPQYHKNKIKIKNKMG